MQVVATALPRSYGGLNFVERIEPAAQALANQNVQFNFGHIEPTSVSRRVDELEALPELFGLFRREGLVKRTGFMGAQVVHDEDNLLGSLVMSGELLDKDGPVVIGFPFGRLDEPSPCERLAREEDRIDAASFVLIVVPLQTSPCAWKRGARLFNELLGASRPCRLRETSGYRDAYIHQEPVPWRPRSSRLPPAE